MITTSAGEIMQALYPPPLFIQKKQRKATLGRRILRKSTHVPCSNHDVLGPLDDIIERIKSAIWNAPPDFSLDSTHDWTNPLKAPSTWTLTSLPVSRTPSSQPLTIRKNRNSRSSGSGSSMGDPRVNSHRDSQKPSSHSSGLASLLMSEMKSSSQLDAPASCEPKPLPTRIPTRSVGARVCTAQKALEDVIQHMTSRSETTTQRPSRLRLLTNGFSRLHRTSTEESSESMVRGSEHSSSPIAMSLENTDLNFEKQNPAEKASTRDVRRSEVVPVTKIIPSQQLFSATESQLPGLYKNCLMNTSNMPTTLRAAVRIFPETKVISEDCQDLTIAVEVEGVLHNRRMRPDATIDVILLLDTRYYVTRECLHKAVDAVDGIIPQLGRGDRVALYTTHCTSYVTGTKSEQLFPLQSLYAGSQKALRDLTSTIAGCDARARDSTEDRLPMNQVVLDVAESLLGDNCKFDRTHLMLFSPEAHDLHEASRRFSNLYIHQINPAALPFRYYHGPQDAMCADACCRNISFTNLASYQSVPLRLRRIIKNARAEKPIGDLTEISIDIQPKNGCQIKEYTGEKSIPTLRLGQVHIFLAKIQVTRAETKDLEFANTVLTSSIAIRRSVQQGPTPLVANATKIHLLDIQTLHRNSLHAVDCWSYTETPLQLMQQAGGLMAPRDTAMEVYKRQYFHQLVQLATGEAGMQASVLLAALSINNVQARKVLEAMTDEIKCHQAIHAYEGDHCQPLPWLHGSIDEAFSSPPVACRSVMEDEEHAQIHGVCGMRP